MRCWSFRYRNVDELNYLVGNLVICKLREKGFDVVNCTPGAVKSLGYSLSQRCNIASNTNVYLCISIHHNASGGEGSEALVYKEGLGSQVGIAVLCEVQKLGYRNRGESIGLIYLYLSILLCQFY